MSLHEQAPLMWPSFVSLLLLLATGLAAWRGRLARRRAIPLAAVAVVGLAATLGLDRGSMEVTSTWSADDVQNQLGTPPTPFTAQQIVDARAQSYNALAPELVAAWAADRGGAPFELRKLRIAATDRRVQLTSTVSLVRYLLTPRALMERADFAQWVLHATCQRNLTMVQLHKSAQAPQAAASGLVQGRCHAWASAALSRR